MTGGAINGTVQAHNGSVLAFIPHTLLEGEVGPTSGPFLQLIAPDCETSAGGIDLTQPPYNLGSGSPSGQTMRSGAP